MITQVIAVIAVVVFSALGVVCAVRSFIAANRQINQIAAQLRDDRTPGDQGGER